MLPGRPSEVTRNMTDSIVSETRRIKQDVCPMTDPELEVMNRALALDYLGYGSELDAAHTLKAIVC